MKKILIVPIAVFSFFLVVAFIKYDKPTISQNIVKVEAGKGVYDIFQCGNDAKCMDTITESLLVTKGAKEVLAELDELGKNDSRILLQCHPIAHSIGRITYKKARNVGEVFQQCDYTCHSGCFHGAMERIFLDDQKGDENSDSHPSPQAVREKIPKVCEDLEFGSHGNLRFQCLHGLGHAVLFFQDYEMNEALKTCDLLSLEWDRRSCYGGLFMENIFAVNKSKRNLSEDPQFPCNVVEEKYKTECYVMQTSRMLELGFSYEQIGKECEEANDYRHTCMQSLGRDASNDARIDSKSTTICMKLPTEDDKQYCIRGLVYALTDNSWDGRYAFPYCDSLPILIHFCYETTISHLLDALYIDKESVMNSCRNHSSYHDCVELARNN